MNTKLMLMVGPAGAGKSTFIQNYINNSTEVCHVVSRDKIRFNLLTDTDSYFDKENQVFAIFIETLQICLNDAGVDVVFADATHLTEKARNKVLDALDLTNVDIIPVVVAPEMEIALRQNEMREGLARVPRSVIRRMYYQLEEPTYNEKYKYTKIIKVGEKNVEDLVD